MGRDEMRAGDADRQGVADALRAALDEGRLDLNEYDARLQGTYAAKTYGELDGLLADLPSTIGARQSQVVPHAAAPVAGSPVTRPAAGDVTQRWLVDTWDDYAAIVGLTTMIWLISSIASSDLLFFWPMWVAGPLGVILIVKTVVGLTQGEPQRWAEKEEHKRVRREEKRRQKALRDDTPC